MVEELWSQPAGWACKWPTFLQLCFLCVAKRKQDEIGQAQGGGPGTQQTLHFLQIAGEIDTVLNSLGVAWSSLGTMICYL